MMVENSLDFFYFEIEQAPSEIPARCPDQFSFSGQICLHSAVATLKGLVQYQNNKKKF